MSATLSDRFADSVRGRAVAARALALALLLGATWLYYVAGRGLSFFYDEWDIVLDRRGNDPAALLAPHNGHLIAGPVLAYRALMALVGLRHYGPYRLVEIGLHLACVSLLYVLVSRRLGGAVALAAAASLLFLGRAWQDLLWPFQITYLGAVAGGLAALLLLQRRTVGGDLGATLALLAALSCSGLGVPFVVLVATTLLLDRRDWQRLWLAVVPALAYGVWYLHWGQSELTASNLRTVPRYVYHSLAGSVGAVFGVGPGPGEILAAIALASVAAVIARRRQFAAAAPPAAGALTFWILAALTRGQLQEPTASRYLYPGAVFLVLIAVGLAADLRVPAPAVLVLAVVVIGASISNIHVLHQGAAGLRSTDVTVDAELTGLQLERDRISPSFQPDPTLAPQVTAGRYFDAVRELGSPALPLSTLAAQSPEVLTAVDRMFVRSLAPDLLSRRRAAVGSAGVAVDGYGAGTVIRRAGCADFMPAAHSPLPPSFDVTVPTRGLLLRSAGRVELLLRRYADAYPSTPSAGFKGGTALLRPAPDASRVAWHVRVVPRTAAVACAAGRP